MIQMGCIFLVEDDIIKMLVRDLDSAILFFQISQVYSESSLPLDPNSAAPTSTITTSATVSTKGGQGKVQQITLNTGGASSGSSQTSSVSNNIQQLAKRYCQVKKLEMF